MENKILTEKKIIRFRSRLINEEKSTATIEKYIRDVNSLCCFLAGRAITKELIMEYKKSLISRGYAVRSVNSMLVSVNNLLVFLGLADCKVKTIKIQRQVYCTEDKELTREEYFRLLHAAQGNMRLCLLIQTICGTGIRVSELQYFTIETVRKGEIVISCKGKTRNILVPGKLKRKLLSYAQKAGIHSGVIFRTKSGNPMNRSNIWTEMKKLCQRAKVNACKVFPHNLRKLFARTFYGIEKDIARLADILGHSNIETTRIYIVTTGKEHRRKIERMGLLI